MKNQLLNLKQHNERGLLGQDNEVKNCLKKIVKKIQAKAKSIIFTKNLKVVKTIGPKTILSNLEAINDSYVLENVKRLNDPPRQDQTTQIRQ